MDLLQADMFGGHDEVSLIPYYRKWGEATEFMSVFWREIYGMENGYENEFVHVYSCIIQGPCRMQHPTVCFKETHGLELDPDEEQDTSQIWIEKGDKS